MNYIRHLNKAQQLFFEDDRLSPNHISLYMALFQTWNFNRFADAFPIDRTKLMKAAKIGSLSTYTKCLKQLEEWQYLSYNPTSNPAIPSRVHLYNLCTATCTENSTAAVPETVPPPYINITNKINLKRSAFAPPTTEEVFDFFKAKNQASIEAEKFYNHFQSNGWKVGGKTTMKDWHAAARNWILNKNKFNSHAATQKHHPPKPGQLHTTSNKDYAQPL